MMLKSILYSRTSPKMLLLAMVSAAYPVTSLAVTAGKVEFSIGNVAAVGPDGRSRPLAKGAEISTGETIHTADGRIQVRFTDGGYISLSPNTEFRIDDYNYEGKTDGNEKSFFSLVKGGLRAITGAIGHVNKKSYLVNTPVATIGIRGTEFLARMDGKLLVKVGDGAVYLSNPAGDIVLYKGQSGEVGSPGEKPQHSDEQPQVNAAGPKGGTPGETQQEQQQRQQNQFNYVAGQDADASGNPCAVLGNCATQDAGLINGIGAISHTDDDNGSILTQLELGFPISLGTNSAGQINKIYSGNWDAVVQNDATIDSTGSYNTIKWQRWMGGTVIVTEAGGSPEVINLKAAHLIYGQPTSPADMEYLVANDLVGTYSLVGYTTPSITYSDGSTYDYTGAVSGALTAFFGTGYVSLALGVGNGTISGTAYGNSIAGPVAFSVSGPATWGVSSGATLEAVGFFSGPHAAQAGITYQFVNVAADTSVNGAAAFKQDSLIPNSNW